MKKIWNVPMVKAVVNSADAQAGNGFQKPSATTEVGVQAGFAS